MWSLSAVPAPSVVPVVTMTVADPVVMETVVPAAMATEDPVAKESVTVTAVPAKAASPATRIRTKNHSKTGCKT